MNPIDRYIEVNHKSPGLALTLALLLGPLGLAYANPMAGVLMLIGAILGGMTLGVFVPLLVWLASILYAPIAANSHNDRAEAAARLLAAGWQQGAQS